MFGFLPGPQVCCAKSAACYRAHFCGLCNVLRRDYGLWARWLINRDSTFLALLGAAQSEASLATSPATCCNPWAQPRDLFQNGSVVHYAAAVTMCGLTAKLDDDAEDERGPRRWISTVGRQALDHCTTQAVGLLHALDFPVSKVMQALRDDASHRSKCMAVDEAAQPTASAYEEIVAHTGTLTGANQTTMEALRDIGRQLGFLIYTQDALEDWETDRRKKRFNPFQSLTDVDERRSFVLPRVETSLTSLRQSFARVVLHRNRDLLSSTLVAGAEMRMQRTLHIQKAKDDDPKKRKRKKREWCDRCDCGGCDCSGCDSGLSCCRHSSGSHGPSPDCVHCDCNPCDGNGCECGACDCSCDCG